MKREMNARFIASALLAFVLSAFVAGKAGAATIDDWNTPQMLSTPPEMVEEVVSGSVIIGGYRGSILSAASDTDANSLSISDGRLTFTVDAAAANNVFATTIWAGPPPGEGLGGVDVTDGGVAKGFLLEVPEAEGSDTRLDFEVRDATENGGAFAIVIPDVAQDFRIFLPFSEFIGANQPVAVDMTQVDHVMLQMEATPGSRIVLGPIRTAVPEPTSIGLWALVGLAGLLAPHAARLAGR